MESLFGPQTSGSLMLPSIAITRTDAPSLPRFGEVMLVLDPSVVQPGPATRVFAADAWTARTPESLRNNHRIAPQFRRWQQDRIAAALQEMRPTAPPLEAQRKLLREAGVDVPMQQALADVPRGDAATWGQMQAPVPLLRAEAQEQAAAEGAQTRQEAAAFPGGLAGLGAWRLADLVTPIPTIPGALTLRRVMRRGETPTLPTAPAAAAEANAPTGWETAGGLGAPPTISGAVDLPPWQFDREVFGRFEHTLNPDMPSPAAPLAHENPLMAYIRRLNETALYDPFSSSSSRGNGLWTASPPGIFTEAYDANRQAWYNGGSRIAEALAPVVRADELGPALLRPEPIRTADNLGHLTSRLVGTARPFSLSASNNTLGRLYRFPVSDFEDAWDRMPPELRLGIQRRFGEEIDPTLLARQSLPYRIDLNQHRLMSGNAAVDTLAHELGHAIDFIGLPVNYFRQLTQPERLGIIRASLVDPVTARAFPGQIELGRFGFGQRVNPQFLDLMDRAATGQPVIATQRFISYDASPAEIVARALGRQLLTRDEPYTEQMLREALSSPQMQRRIITGE